MRKIGYKLASIITIFILLTIYIMPIGYAVSNDNIKLDILLNGKRDIVEDISKDIDLNIRLDLENIAYIKEMKIAFKDPNFSLREIKDINIKQMGKDYIIFNEIKNGEKLDVHLKAYFDINKKIGAKSYKNENIAVCEIGYVDKNAINRKIKKEIKNKLSWNTKTELQVKQTLARHVEIGDKTLVTLAIEEDSTNKLLPYKTTKIELDIPSYNNKNPIETTVIPNDNIKNKSKYEIKNSKILINIENKDSNTDKNIFYISYLYDTKLIKTKLNSQIKVDTTYLDDTRQDITVKNEFDLEKQYASVLLTNEFNTKNITKGYMYPAEKIISDTYFNYSMNINIPSKQIVDRVFIKENKNQLDGNDINNKIFTSMISVEESNFVEMLGDDGYIDVVDAKTNRLITTIRKNNLKVNLKYGNIKLETSQIIKEGNLHFDIQKCIISSKDYNYDFIETLKQLQQSYITELIRDKKIVATNEYEFAIDFNQTKTNFELKTNKLSYSTMTINKDVEFNIVLKTSSLDDRLYKDPIIKLVLPEEVDDFDITNAKLLYGSDMKVVETQKNNKEIYIKMEGTQLKHINKNIADGMIINVNANITLNKMSLSKKTDIKLYVYNDNDKKTLEVTTPIEIVAPLGFITAQKIEDSTNKKNSAEAFYKEELLKTKPLGNEFKANISGKTVNNNSVDIQGFELYLQIPATGLKDLFGEDEKNQFDTQLDSDLIVKGINGKIYYSENINEHPNSNNWSEIRNAKSKVMKFVSDEAVKPGQFIQYAYRIKVAENLPYNKVSKAKSLIIYQNQAKGGNKQSFIEAKSVGIIANTMPNLITDIAILDYNTNKLIDENNPMPQGQMVKLLVNIKNLTDKDIEKLDVKINLPEQLKGYVLQEYGKIANYVNENLYYHIPLIAKGTTHQIGLPIICEEYTPEILELNTVINNEQLGTYLKTIKKFKVKKEKLKILFESNVKDKYVSNKEKVLYEIKINKLDLEDKKEKPIKVDMQLPDGVSIENIDAKDINVEKDNDKKNHFIFTKEKYDGTFNVFLNCNAEIETDKDEEARINVYYDNEKIKILPIKSKFRKNLFRYNIISNTNKLVKDDEIIKIKGSLENISDIPLGIKITETIPKGMKIDKINILDKNGSVEETINKNSIDKNILLDEFGKGIFEIILIPDMIKENTYLDTLTNITFLLGDKEIATKEFNYKVVGTHLADNALVGTTLNEKDKQQVSTVPGTKSISGNVWIDENNDGLRQQDEKMLNGIKVALYDKNTNKIVENALQEKMITSTNSNGEYKFNNLIPGQYIAKIEYDNNNYDIAKYNVNNNINEGNGFIKAVNGSDNLATSDIIKLDDEVNQSLNLGLLKKPELNISLEQKVEKILIGRPKKNKKVYEADSNLVKVELDNRTLKDASAFIKYNITVKNDGNISAYVKSIVNYNQKDLDFISILNKDWYIGKDGNYYNDTLGNKLLNPGETATITIWLRKKLSDDNTGLIRNVSEVKMIYNNYGYIPTYSTPGNKKDGERDMGAAEVLIQTNTGKYKMLKLSIVLEILAVAGILVYIYKNYIIKNIRGRKDSYDKV